MSSDDIKNRYSGRDGSKYSGKDGARGRDGEGSGYEDIGNKGSKYSGSYWDDRERSEFAHEIGFEAESFRNSYAQQDRSVTHDYVDAQQQLVNQRKRNQNRTR
ncbi:MAG: hypothetical protein ACOX8O_00330 [Christensenellales bacterium]